MATIDLDQTDGQQQTLGYFITAKREPYRGLPIFEKITFKDVYETSFKLLGLYKTMNNYRYYIQHSYDAKIDNADYVRHITLYYYKTNYDIPIFIEFDIHGEIKYHKFTDLSHEGYHIYELKTEIPKSANFLDEIITRNDLVNGLITYRVDKMDSYNNIKVEEKHIDGLNDYTIYVHTPKEDKFKKHKSCILYDKYLFEIKPGSNQKEAEENTPLLKSIQEKIINSINVYYRSSQNSDKIPLLVECIEGDKKYYFSRKSQHEKSWYIDDPDEYSNEKLRDKLDTLEFEIKHSVLVLLHKKYNYKKGSMDPTINSNKDSREHKETNSHDEKTNDEVWVQKESTNSSNYECYRHDLKSYSENKNIQDKFNFENLEFKVLKFFISYRCVEIYDQDIPIPLLYNGNIYVYFYNDDHFPLMIKHDKDFYGPKSKDKYFVEWEKIEKLKDSDNTQLFKPEVIEQLDNINAMLNEIDIHKTSDYGIDDYFYDDSEESNNKQKSQNQKIFDFTRIKVESEEIDIYKKYTHTTKNRSKIKKYSFSKRRFFKNKQNTISTSAISFSVYYFTYDAISNRDYPLILEIQSEQSKFEYYITEANGLDFYEYEHNYLINNGLKTENIKKLLEHQNFNFNKVISIFLQKDSPYTCCDIKNKPNCISFLDNKYYYLCYIDSKHKKTRDECGVRPFIHVKKLKKNSPLKSTSYSIFKHTLDLSHIYFTLPKPINPKLIQKFCDYTINKIIIANKTITLKYKNEKQRFLKATFAYVHFYREDPRPLLVYCDKVIFYPESKDKYFEEWHTIEDDEFYKFSDRNHFPTSLEYKLDEIYYNLNPIDVHNTQNYPIDKNFDGPMIQVDTQCSTLFKKFIHTTKNEYKLGIAKYKEFNIIGDYKSYNYKLYKLESISVFYPNCDTKYDYPLVIEFHFKVNIPNNNQFNEYYELESIETYKWKKTEYKNLNCKGEIKQIHLINLFKKFSKDTKQPETIDTNLFEDKDCINEENQDMDIDQQRKNIFDMVDPYTPENFEHKDIIINLPFDNQFNHRLDFDYKIKGESSSYDFYKDHNFSNNYNGNYFKPSIIQTIDLETNDIMPENKDIEKGKSIILDIMPKNKGTRHTREIHEETSMLNSKLDDSTGEVKGSSNSDSNLGPALGGVFGSLLFIGSAAYPVYKYWNKFKFKDMRPIF